MTVHLRPVFQYTSGSDGSVMGVTVSRAAMLAQGRTLTSACGYTEGEICVCVVDFKREVRLYFYLYLTIKTLHAK